MRRTFALGIAGVALAASFLPVTSASAVCSWAWQAVTGQCSPCNTIGGPYNTVDRTLGDKLPSLDCLA